MTRQIRRRALLAAALASVAGAICKRGLGAASSGQSPANARSCRVVLLGDCLFTQGLVRDDGELRRLLPILRNADVTVGNFEGTLADAGSWASVIDPGGTPICGGLNIRGDDAVAADLAWLGVDMVGTANNHAMDWGPGGLLATARKLSAAGIQHCGTGKDLSDARRPAYYAGPGGRTALISCASTYWPGALASHGNSAIPGRPGVNPVRVRAAGSGTGGAGSVDPRDLHDILDSVREARQSSDAVLVSCHTHEGAGDRLTPPAFLLQLARACIDSGADVFFSHGPHVLRGIELYNGKPIFYGLGAFIFRARETGPLPEELFENCEMTSRDPLELFERTSRGWEQDREFWQAAIAQVDFDRGKIVGVSLIPTVIRHAEGGTWGMPRLADSVESEEILARVRKLSASFGTTLQTDDSTGRLRF